VKIISSQHFIDWETVERKMDEIAGVESVEIPCCEIGEIDGHHTLAAARELGIPVEFVFDEDPEGLTGDDYLMAHYIDGDWYDVERSNPAEEKYCLIW